MSYLFFNLSFIIIITYVVYVFIEYKIAYLYICYYLYKKIIRLILSHLLLSLDCNPIFSFLDQLMIILDDNHASFRDG